MENKSTKYAEDLSKLIQCPTVSASGHEYFVKFHEALQEVFPLIHENAEIVNVSSDALLFKWKGKSDKKPLVLMGHQDVVPAVDKDWTHPPFGGEIADGKVWGRGAMDCKNTVYISLRAIEELMSEGFVPEYDTYFSSSDSEEISGPGAPSIRDYLKNQGVKPAIVVDEGGVILDKVFPGVKRPFAVIGIYEKGYGNIKFTARGDGGHSSTPPKNTPVERLARFITDVHSHRYLRNHISDEVTAMFKAFAPQLKQPLKIVLSHTTLFKPLIKFLLPKLSSFGRALLTTTLVFTMTTASTAPNVIPREASAVANVRFSKHQPKEETIALLTKLAAKYGIETEVLEARDASSVTDIESEGFKYMSDCIKKCFPDVGVAPYVMMGGTDCHFFQDICDCGLRFTPVRLSQAQMSSMHAADENIDVDTLVDGVNFFKYFIANYR
ncbi:MAG: M20/M25/M40 family metallo-hydrolase [Clostridiaceae bacterium]|jgi:carboxypeptidase PM20D1|nr:M20/M25/M40 family metallo-hydrolase [Clostridiaceae bacterium]